jgi:hypothetical protein
MDFEYTYVSQDYLDLPAELWLEILSKIEDDKTYATCCRVNKRWKEGKLLYFDPWFCPIGKGGINKIYLDVVIWRDN